MENKIIKILYSNYKKNLGKFFRFSSKPFVSGDTFRNYADHIYDETKNLNPNKVKFGQIVFVKSDLLEIYFRIIHPSISNKYILISHNSDISIHGDLTKNLDEKILFWFAQNLCCKSDSKLKMLPIGIENRWYFKNGKVGQLKKFANMKNIKKEVLLSLTFNTHTNQFREKVKDLAQKNNITSFLTQNTKDEYLMTLKKSKFTICPPGNGPDTHRLWEALLFECIPVVQLNSFTSNFKLINLPILYLNSWKELSDLSEKFLNEFYIKNLEILTDNKFSYFEFWQQYINQYLDE